MGVADWGEDHNQRWELLRGPHLEQDRIQVAPWSRALVRFVNVCLRSLDLPFPRSYVASWRQNDQNDHLVGADCGSCFSFLLGAFKVSIPTNRGQTPRSRIPTASFFESWAPLGASVSAAPRAGVATSLGARPCPCRGR